MNLNSYHKGAAQGGAQVSEVLARRGAGEQNLAVLRDGGER